MTEDNKIPHMLDQSRPSLSDDEKVSIWNAVEANMSPAQPILSPYTFTTLFKQKTYIMAPIALFLAVILGGGATAYASDAAKPGDILFPVERMIENMQLRLTFSDEARQELVEELTQERLSELREIIDEEVTISPSNASDEVPARIATSTATSTDATLSDFSIDARVFNDTTVVKLELDGQKFYFETDGRTKQDVITEVISRFPILTDYLQSEASQDRYLSFEVSDRESRPNDRGIVSLSEEGQERINTAIDALLAFLDETEADESLKDIAVASLATEIGDTEDSSVEAVREEDELRISDKDERVMITIDDEGNSSVEVRSKKARVKIEDHDGELKVEKEREDDDDHRSDSGSDTVALGDYSVVATTYNDITMVTVTLGADSFSFATSATTTEDIALAVTTEFPVLTLDDVTPVLDVVTVAAESTPADRGEDSITSDTQQTAESFDDDDSDTERKEDIERDDDDQREEHALKEAKEKDDRKYEDDSRGREERKKRSERDHDGDFDRDGEEDDD